MQLDRSTSASTRLAASTPRIELTRTGDAVRSRSPTPDSLMTLALRPLSLRVKVTGWEVTAMGAASTALVRSTVAWRTRSVAVDNHLVRVQSRAAAAIR